MGLFKSKADRLFERAKDDFKFRNGGPATFAKIEQAAEMGSESAKGFLMEYYTGSLPEYHNGAKAVPICEYFIKKRNLPYAKFHLGRLCYWGDGVPQDFTRAYQLFSEAANARKFDAPQGNGYIGMMYFWGDGVPQSYEKAGEYLGQRITLTFCDYEWDVLYCYRYMQLHGLGGIPKNEKDAWNAMEEISGRKDLSPRTRKACTELVCEQTLDSLERLLKQSSPNYNSVQLCLRRLETASENGLLVASLALAFFYLNYTVTETRTVRDYETNEVEILSETTSAFDQEARTCLGKVQLQLDGSPKGEREKKYLERLLKHRVKIEQLKPGVFQALLDDYK